MSTNKHPNFLRLNTGDTASILVPLLFVAITAVTRIWWLVIAEALVLAIYAVYRIITRKRYNEQLYNYLQSMTEYLDEASRENLTCFPMPITLLDAKGSIIWYNDLFYDILQKNHIQSLFGHHISKISEAIQLDKISAEHQKFNISYLGQFYTVYCMRQGKDEKGQFFALYWMNDDALKRENIRLKSEQLCIGYILIDSYDEIPSDVSEIQRSGFVNRVSVKIRKLSHSINGVLKVLEQDKYLLIFEQKYLPKLEKNKFHILEEVKDITIGERVRATLSIGVSRVHGSLREIDQSARTALDMALSRGGDQVAITNGEKYTFFGGKAQTAERKKRVKVRIISEALAAQIAASDNVIIMGHKYADLDCLGSAISLAHCVNLLARPAYVVVNPKETLASGMIDVFRDNPEYDGVFVEPARALKLVEENTLLIIVDTHSVQYIESEKIYRAADHVALIDHHRKVAAGAIENTLIHFHEPNASSCCEMVTELIDNLPGCQIGKQEATALMAGIILDTKNFTERTGVRTFEAAAYLKGRGADSGQVQTYFKNEIDTYKKQIEMINNAFLYGKDIMISVYDAPEFEGIKMSASKAADELLTIKGITASFVLYWEDDEVHISARSEADKNVQTIMEKMGGGGHRNAAGTQIPEISMKTALENLKKILDEEEE